MGGHPEDRDRLFSVVLSERMRGNRYKLKNCLKCRKYFFTLGKTEKSGKLPRGIEEFSSLEIFKS